MIDEKVAKQYRKKVVITVTIMSIIAIASIVAIVFMLKAII